MPPPPFFFFRKSKAVSLSSQTTCKNSNHALNVLQFKSPPTFFQLLHSISNPGVFPAGVGSQPRRGPSFQLTTDHESAASVWLPLCIAPQSEWPPRVHPDLLITCFEWCWNVFWPLFLSKHMWNTWESFTDGAGGGGGGGGRAVQGRICRGLKTPVTYYHYRLWSVSSLVSFVISFLLW